MTDTPLKREDLKRACLNRLEEIAMEHPLGHQGKLAARYLLRRLDGDVIEIMFEKGPRSPANLWVGERFMRSLVDGPIPFRLSPARTLFAARTSDGRTLYGRHSALRPMRQLGTADLVCFALRSLADLELVLQALIGEVVDPDCSGRTDRSNHKP
ncbi:hypothetical protein [Nioella ostreopsis]|uniref:hypothetical protein n=1 Tax=Nioella ostreopsis TaxID=2448479 RepID=UPI001F0BA563|nr:hypothetical protein [Nioella ostreopsis]